ncbi:MAG: sigma-54-dependent Fis family transcriptional regulator [Bdellovibrio sp.]|nr:sigma-54-dependent Fis family transcriptional regulator [Bdellovibrio sp.]
MATILLVDDDLQALESTRKILEFAGYQVTVAMDGQQALEAVRPTPSKDAARFDLVVTDVRMPKLGGLEFLRALSLCGENLPVILMTAFGRIEDAVWAMKLGAVDFLTKPFKRQTLLTSVEAALKRGQSLKFAGSMSSARLLTEKDSENRDPILGRSRAIQILKDLIERVAPTHVTLLLTGESGTGKELVARRIHQLSSRADRKFIALNCAAVPEHLMESELFGFEKGAFTGATGAKEGLFEAAHQGTLLLDEIGDMPLPLQAKLLRVLQENEVRRIGSTQTKKVDVRVVAATHKDLKAEVAAGRFRQDLLYRLEVVGVHVPPLRERMEDLSELVAHFLRHAGMRHGKTALAIKTEVLEVLASHTWPGNVRELGNVIERAVVLSREDSIGIEELPPHLIVQAAGHPGGAVGSSISVPLGTSLKDVEELLIRKTLEATSGDKNMTAKLLGINSRTIYRKLEPTRK